MDDEGKTLDTTRVYADSVGQVLAVETGTRVTYKLMGDELYVRTTITSSKPHPNASFEGQREQAWTQPVGWRRHAQNDGADTPTPASGMIPASPAHRHGINHAMKRVLSGIQPSGQLHIGNYAGAISQFVDMQADHEMFVFVASYHALTSTRDAEELRANTRQVVTDYLAFGLDPATHPDTHIYLQQDVPQVTELAWMLSCVCPKHLMDKATSYKDKVARGLPASVGLYTYPILQAADILSVDPDLVPVGQGPGPARRDHPRSRPEVQQRLWRGLQAAGLSVARRRRGSAGDRRAEDE